MVFCLVVCFGVNLFVTIFLCSVLFREVLLPHCRFKGYNAINTWIPEYLVLATTWRLLWASTKPSCLEHVEEKSSIDKQSDSIGNQTVEIDVRVRVSKSRFWCRFWSRSCVISVSTDSQKKKLKKKSRSTKTSQTPQAWWKSSESVHVDLRKVYGNPTCTILFVDLPSSNMRSPCGSCDDGEKTWRWGVRFFFISSLKLATCTDSRNARLWMVSWQEKKKKKKSKPWRNGRKLPIHGLECLVLAWPGTTVERGPEKEKLWQSTRGE